MKFIGVQDNKDEWLKSELPALEQLYAMGYEYKSQSELNKERKDLREVLLYDGLQAAIRKHNPELDEDGVYDALSEINESRFLYTLDTMDTNEKIRAKLVGLSRTCGLEPITVTQNFGEGNVEKTVKLFDFDNPENNDFLVTNQFQLDGLKQPIYPDIIIFVNGIPLVIIECKSPYIKDPINEAVEKNFARYQSRGSGYERLIFFNHFLVAACGTLARHGTIGANVNHYARWSESYPLTEEDIEKMCEGRKPREQEILIAGMLSKSHLLDLLKNDVIYEVDNNRKIKKLAKHQQYRVVTKAVERLNLEEENIADKGGVIWHTQGSGFMYLDKGLREHTLLQAIARVNRIYDVRKTYGLIVDYCGITKDLQKALAIFEEEDVKGALEPAEKELEELKNRYQEVMSFFSDVDKDNDDAIIEKFEPVNIRDDFEYAFKMFSKALDIILPRKEADPYIPDFRYVSKIRQMIRTYYEGVGHSLRVDGKKVQQLIDDHIRSLDISELMNPKEVTYDNFLGYAAKFKSERARTALIKNKARQIIKELAATNPAYYEKLRERLEKIIEQEEKRRKGDASYFDSITQVYNEALDSEKQRKNLGFSTPFEFAVYEELQSIRNDDSISKKTTNSIFGKVEEEIRIVGWKTKTSSEKKLSIAIYDILTENKYPEDKVNEIAMKIIDLAKRNLP